MVDDLCRPIANINSCAGIELLQVVVTLIRLRTQDVSLHMEGRYILFGNDAAS
jgi:hypothetical protein